MPAPKPTDQPSLLKLQQRAQTAIVRLGQISSHFGIGAVMTNVQIVDQQQIDARHAEPLQAVLEAPHHAVVTIIESVLELQAPTPEPMLEILRIVDRSEQPADLGRQDIIGPRPPIQRPPKAVLALPPPIPRGRIVVADAGVPRRPQRGIRVNVLDHVKQIAQPRTAQAELRDLNVSAAKFAAGEGVHNRLSSVRAHHRIPHIRSGSHVAIAGKAIRIAKRTRSVSTNGITP